MCVCVYTLLFMRSELIYFEMIHLNVPCRHFIVTAVKSHEGKCAYSVLGHFLLTTYSLLNLASYPFNLHVKLQHPFSTTLDRQPPVSEHDFFFFFFQNCVEEWYTSKVWIKTKPGFQFYGQETSTGDIITTDKPKKNDLIFHYSPMGT